MIIVLSILIVLLIVLIYFMIYYLAALAAVVAIVLFVVKYFEPVRIAKPEDRKLIGQKCLVIHRVRRGGRGIVRAYNENGQLDPELWSAELATNSEEILENQTARVVGIRSIILLIEKE